MITNDHGMPRRILEVVGMLAEGQTAKEIARALGISPNTVNSYVQTARDITGAKNTTAMVACAMRRGWIQ